MCVVISIVTVQVLIEAVFVYENGENLVPSFSPHDQTSGPLRVR